MFEEFKKFITRQYDEEDVGMAMELPGALEERFNETEKAKALNAYIVTTPDQARDMARASDAKLAKGEGGALEHGHELRAVVHESAELGKGAKHRNRRHVRARGEEFGVADEREARIQQAFCEPPVGRGGPDGARHRP